MCTVSAFFLYLKLKHIIFFRSTINPICENVSIKVCRFWLIEQIIENKCNQLQATCIQYLIFFTVYAQWKSNNVKHMCGILRKSTRSQQMSFVLKCKNVQLVSYVFSKQPFWNIEELKNSCFQYEMDNKISFGETCHCFSQNMTHNM